VNKNCVCEKAIISALQARLTLKCAASISLYCCRLHYFIFCHFVLP